MWNRKHGICVETNEHICKMEKWTHRQRDQTRGCQGGSGGSGMGWDLGLVGAND